MKAVNKPLLPPNIKIGLIASWVSSLLLLTLCFGHPAQAERMESDSFVVQFGNFNSGSGEQDSTSYNLTQTLGQIAPGPYSSATKFLGSGFQYIYTINYFRFAISKLYVNFEELQAGTHKTDSNVLSIDTKGAGGYIVYAYETHPLMHSNNTDVIPDTTCNAGTCTQTTAQPWTNQAIPGFGFNIAGADVPTDFTNTTYFRQFADKSNSEAMQIVMSSPSIAFRDFATVTYKAGVSASQAAGNYRTEIIYIAVPGFWSCQKIFLFPDWKSSPP